ncbi:MAG TPA: YbhB/YbcL family Raf kinase inhibitor-like protein [Solirubrobacteraceae bacterium]|jgi:hypothetical protein|nr:YbhB/YbcL family Raf kinase inhibitor-like protein [Solirubrobacteraceae bacterium]
MPTHRVVSSLLAILVMALLAGCGGGSTATQSAGVASSSLTTTSSVTPSVSASNTSTSASTSTSSPASTSTTARTTHSTQSVKPSTAGGTAPGGSAARAPSAKTPSGKFALASAAFPHGGQIPARYTCDGGNVSPPLQWGKLPAGTSQLFVLALSLTAGASGAIRWAVGGIDPNSGGIPAGQLPAGAVAGRSGDGHIGWSGICGARGKPQAVIVLVYALRHPLHLSSGFDPRTVQSQLAGDTLGSGVVYGAYKKP